MSLVAVPYNASATINGVATVTLLTTSLTPGLPVASFQGYVAANSGVVTGVSLSGTSSAANTAAASSSPAVAAGLQTVTVSPKSGPLATCSTDSPSLSCVYLTNTVETYAPVAKTVTTQLLSGASTFIELSWELRNAASTSSPSSASTGISDPNSSVSGASGISTTQAKSSSTPPKGNGISTGVVAGVAVACLIGGALVAGLIAFFILKKRPRGDRYGSRNTYVPAASPAYGGEKGMPMVSITPVGAMDFLPQQADDAEVKRKLSTIIDQIDQHVENFYGNRGAPIDPSWEGELSRFDTNELPLPLVACFQNSAAPMTLIKHCLAYYVFNLTVSPDEHRTSLLPSELAGTVAAMYHRTLSSAATKDNITAFSTWKSLTKYLRPDLGRDTSTDQKISEGSARIAMHFTNIFAPWANTQYSSDARARHLTELLNEAVQTAIWLFGQPDNYRFEWDVPNTRQDTNYSAVIVPAVWKTTHSATRLTGKGQNVLAPVIKGF